MANQIRPAGATNQNPVTITIEGPLVLFMLGTPCIWAHCPNGGPCFCNTLLPLMFPSLSSLASKLGTLADSC